MGLVRRLQEVRATAHRRGAARERLANQFKSFLQFGSFAEARSGLNQAQQQMSQTLQADANPEAVAAVNEAVARNLDLFINVAVEAYPTLRANENFIRLQDELTETENRISVSRRDYNETVAEYNTYIRRFPAVLTAKVIGADRRETFEAPESARQAPQVRFGS